MESITYPHVVELAGNPMQLAILLNLMQRRAVLPEKRTALYDRYIEVFMDRESKSRIVAANKDVIVSFHKQLGWHIHASIEVGRSNGTINLSDLRKLLVDYLAPRGYATDFCRRIVRLRDDARTVSRSARTGLARIPIRGSAAARVFRR